MTLLYFVPIWTLALLMILICLIIYLQVQPRSNRIILLPFRRISPNIRPTFDVVEDPIIRTPDRPLRELRFTFNDKCSNQKTNILFYGIGFGYSRGPKSFTWRCTSRSKKVAFLAKVSIFKIKHLRIFLNFNFNIKRLSKWREMGHQNRAISPSYLIPKKIHTTILRIWRRLKWLASGMIAKNEGLVNKFKPAKRICEEKLLQLQGNWNLCIIISFFLPIINFFYMLLPPKVFRMFSTACAKSTDVGKEQDHQLQLRMILCLLFLCQGFHQIFTWGL